MSLPELVRLQLEGQKPPEKTIVITFDDGYYDNWATAYPILAEFGVPATIYITTGFIDRTVEPVEFRLAHFINSRDIVEFSWDGHIYTWELQSLAECERCYRQVKELAKPLSRDRRQQLLHRICGNTREEFADMKNQLFMDWDQLIDLVHSPLITIGAHTHSHSLLTTLSSGEVLREIRKSKRLLEDNLGKKVSNFSYPYGAFNQEIKHLLRQCGFISGVTTAPRSMTVEGFDLMAIPRFEVKEEALTAAQTVSKFMEQCRYS
jgi:peptidoglycan/xylan/chitin deacetylase (PgdA/CDA1 family)